MPNLVGIGNSQVPTNAMLGGLAYQDSVGEIDIEKIILRIDFILSSLTNKILFTLIFKQYILKPITSNYNLL